MENKAVYNEITPEITELTKLCVKNSTIDPSLYVKHQVNRGLRDAKGKGVLTGLTEISEVTAKRVIDGKEVGIPGELLYRGYNINDIVGGLIKDNRFGFEEITYLLLMGKLPNKQELASFNALLASYRNLPETFTRDIIMQAPSENMMNAMARSVLTLYSYDKNAEDTSVENVMRQSLHLIATFPLLAAYAYRTFEYFYNNTGKFVVRDPRPDYSTAENILYMLRSGGKFTELEAKVLDLCLIVHAEHGGGNNSSFTTHVVTSSGTDTYSAIAAALGSLKGPKHGGANIKVCQMFENIKANVKNWKDDDEISAYLKKILDKKAFDNSGLIYGIGHAIYSVNDPRCEILKSFVSKLAVEKGREDEYNLYASVERLAPGIVLGNKRMFKGVCANVDFYSGLIYQMLDIPFELFTPLFAIARISGWSAHRIEEIISGGKIIRPAYMAVGERADYIELNDR